VEELLARLGRPQALAQVVSAREAAARRLGMWSNAQFENASKNIDRFLDQGDLPAAYTAAQQLLERCQSAGVEAYYNAANDIAMAHFKLGRVLATGGAAEAALAPLEEAQQQFQALGDTGAARMATVAITERANCLLDLGRYGEAVAAYEEGIRIDEELGDRRGVAACKLNLGTARAMQKRYAEALEYYAEAMKTFESLGEPETVATVWHQIGIVHKNVGQFEQAEQATRQSLAICVQHKLRAGEAGSLGELGNLYGLLGRLEEAVTFYRQAAGIYAKLSDLRHEGLARINLADILIELRRYNEARQELLRTIECNKPFGHAAQSWKTWDTLHNLEQVTGNAQAAANAHGQAVASYLAYRRAGGEDRFNRAPLYALVEQAIEHGMTTEAATQLAGLTQADIPAWRKTLLDKLQAVLHGARGLSLAADPALSYADAVELQLLLERLAPK
jgi:tetratricopeptide (TPR) repeat protein